MDELISEEGGSHEQLNGGIEKAGVSDVGETSVNYP